jgi:hypothetical protein
LRKQVFVIQAEPRRVLGDVDIECSSRKRGSKNERQLTEGTCSQSTSITIKKIRGCAFFC